MSEVKTIEMNLNSGGTFSLDTLDKQLAFASNLMQKGMVSDTYKNPSQLVLAIQQCLALGIDPVLGLRSTYVIGGRPVFFGNLPLAIVKKTGLVELHQEYFVDESFDRICAANKNLKAKPWGAVCLTKRKGEDEILESFFSIDEAISAGLMRNPTWQKFTKDMLGYRARARNLNTKFADCLHGIEMEAIALGTEKEDEKERVNDLNATFSVLDAEPSVQS